MDQQENVATRMSVKTGFKIYMVYCHFEYCMFDPEKMESLSGNKEIPIYLRPIFTLNRSDQPPSTGSLGQMADLMGLLIQRKSLDSKLYDNWNKGGRSGLNPLGIIWKWP